MPSHTLDRTDRKILDLLQRDGRLTNVELAAKVALSPSPCLRRVRALESDGVIRDYVALVDPGRVGLGCSPTRASSSRSAAPGRSTIFAARCRAGPRWWRAMR